MSADIAVCDKPRTVPGIETSVAEELVQSSPPEVQL
jgi:hypothetical protein